MRRAAVLGLITVAVVVGGAGIASAHNEFEPGKAAPGSVVRLILKVENERADAGTTRVELFFPTTTPLGVVAVPAVAGWTSTVKNAPPPSQPNIVWTGGPATADLELPVTIGPLPTTKGRLQFKVLQTYSNGDVDRWIQAWPAGAAEPEMPGPVLDVVAGASGVVPPTSTTPPTTASSTTTSAPTTTSTTTTVRTTDGDGDSGTAAIVAVVAVIGAATIAAIVFLRIRNRRKSPPTEPPNL